MSDESQVTALVADDNQDAARTLQALLEMLGHTVVIASDGTEALAEALRFEPLVIFLDIGMPGMDGWEVCQHIRATCWGSHAHIVAVSGYSQPEHISKSRASGFNRHCRKPLIYETIRQIFDETPVDWGFRDTPSV